MVSKMLIIITLIMLLNLCSSQSQRSPLRFKADHTFTILQITDLHYGETQANDKDTTALIKYLMQESHADFVMITGDAVSGYAWDGKNQTFYQDLHRYFTSPFAEFNIPYAFLLGNHDSQANLNRQQIMQLDMQNPLSHSNKSEGISGASNYWLPILSSYAQNQSLHAVHLWAFDTGGYGCNGNPKGWGCVEIDQIEWYNAESIRVKELFGNPLGLGFFHIPLVEYLEMYNIYPIYDWKREPIVCPFENTGFFQSVFENQNIQHMFCGHQHNNDFGGYMDGIEMGYGRKTGYGAYGPDIAAGELRGGRVFRLTENYPGQVSIEHSILQQDGQWIENTNMTIRMDKQAGQCIYFWSYKNFKREIIERKSYRQI